MVETVVTISLLAIVVLPIMTAVLTGIRSSITARAAAQVETALVNSADRVNRAPNDRICDYTVYARAEVVTLGWPETSASVSHEYLDQASGTWLQGPPGAAACPDGLHRDLLVKRVTLTITSPNGNVSRSIQVVKSDV